MAEASVVPMSILEYRVARIPGCGWLVLRDGDALARRRDVFAAVELANLMAERESVVSSRKVRVSMTHRDVSSWIIRSPSVRAARRIASRYWIGTS